MATLMIDRIFLRSNPSLPATRTLESMPTMLVFQVLLESPRSQMGHELIATVAQK